tara:strand:+ start:6836 stop:7552 length:717 start_codon:yes stop_codon:yes gene_type:complete
VGTFVQTALEVIWGEFDISTDHKAVSLMLNNQVRDSTRYGHTARTSLPGLNAWEANGEGYNDFADNALDESLFGHLATNDVLLSIAPLGATVTQPVYFGNSVQAEFSPMGDEVGEIAAFRWTAEGSDQYGMINGSVALNAQPSATGNGTAYQLGAVAAGQRVYLGLHFLVCSASITVTLESDNAEGFPSATTRVSGAAQSAVGHQFLSAAGAITDDWWRIEYTTGGGTFDIIAVVGIQ